MGAGRHAARDPLGRRRADAHRVRRPGSAAEPADRMPRDRGRHAAARTDRDGLRPARRLRPVAPRGPRARADSRRDRDRAVAVAARADAAPSRARRAVHAAHQRPVVGRHAAGLGARRAHERAHARPRVQARDGHDARRMVPPRAAAAEPAAPRRRHADPRTRARTRLRQPQRVRGDVPQGARRRAERILPAALIRVDCPFCDDRSLMRARGVPWPSLQ
ncbi:hypothetical protein F01_420194 [Burkholderia cenocepacia]|nr:hypothetical protein F01_420194 [Burkholderia cenocepacia]